jgi:hypothetical protein
MLPLKPDDLVEEVIRDHPRVPAFLRTRGIICMQCGEPVWGTLGEVIAAKGMDPVAVLADLNAFLEQPEADSA